MLIYIASSWRCEYQPRIVQILREEGYSVYDFRHPPMLSGFAWSDIDSEWLNWTPRQFGEALHHPLAERGFASDMDALVACDACVLVLPCGRSAHLELGYAVGVGKKTAIFMPELPEPELMYKMVGCVTADEKELLAWLDAQQKPAGFQIEVYDETGFERPL